MRSPPSPLRSAWWDTKPNPGEIDSGGCGPPPKRMERWYGSRLRQEKPSRRRSERGCRSFHSTDLGLLAILTKEIRQSLRELFGHLFLQRALTKGWSSTVGAQEVDARRASPQMFLQPLCLFLGHFPFQEFQEKVDRVFTGEHPAPEGTKRFVLRYRGWRLVSLLVIKPVDRFPHC